VLEAEVGDEDNDGLAAFASREVDVVSLFDEALSRGEALRGAGRVSAVVSVSVPDLTTTTAAAWCECQLKLAPGGTVASAAITSEGSLTSIV
jgi:hypothetical protein